MKKLVILLSAAALACALAACGKKGAEDTSPPTKEFGDTGATGEAAAPRPETARVTAGPLNLRDEAGLKGDVVGRLSEGEKVIVLAKSAGAETIDGKTAYWYEVETIDKKRGWVFGGYLDVGVEEAPAVAGTAEAADAPLAPINVTATADVPGWKPADYYDRGMELARAKQFGEAVIYFKAATERSPQTGKYWFDLGMALQELGRHAEAVTAYERAVVLSPDDFWTHNNLGLACIRAQRPRRAVEVLEKALTLKPRGTTDEAKAKDIVRRNLATAYEMNGQPAKAAALRGE
jgi:tetratricopeptide (TPR) repeat protein/predicted small lipoprotein YifL